jgi:NAD(P)H-hydrate epimerase
VRDDDATDTLAAADVCVDAILGTGTVGAPRGTAAAWIEAANGSERPIVALDLPSGVDATSGRVEGMAIRAVATVTFGWPKIGLLLHPARAHCGRLLAVEIGFPPLDATGSHGAAALTPAWAAARLRARPPDAHKGRSGWLLVVAGQHGMAGAAALSAESARRAGAGLVRVASVESNRAILQTLVPEAIFVDRDRLPEAELRGMTAVVAGPGLGTAPEARDALFHSLEATGSAPVLLDADAINLFAREPDALHAQALRRPVVLTPHPGEMGRLLEMETEEVTGDPPAAARLAAERFGCIVLLKGQPSLVAAPGEPLLVNTVGSSDVAAAGMGDQLTGVIGAFLAAGLGARDAAAAGLFYSARAADIAALGRSLGPRDVTANLHRAFARPGASRSPTGFGFVTFDQPERW